MAAVSQKSSDNPWGDLPPESTEFGFPLYLNITEYDNSYGNWRREIDEINQSFSVWCSDNCVYDDTFLSGYVPVTEETKIYINGGLVEEILFDFGSYILHGENIPFDEVILDAGELYGYGAKLPSSGDGSFGKEIQFHLDLMPVGDLYILTAREGMTWADWVNTDYNTMGIVIRYDDEGDGYVVCVGFVIYNFDSGNAVDPQDEIMANSTYGL